MERVQNVIIVFVFFYYPHKVAKVLKQNDRPYADLLDKTLYGPVMGSLASETTFSLRQVYRAVICENVVSVGRLKVHST